MTGQARVFWYGVGLRPALIEQLARRPGWEPVGLARDVDGFVAPAAPVDVWLVQAADLTDTLRWGRTLRSQAAGGQLCVLVPRGAPVDVWQAAVEAVVGPAPAVQVVSSLDELSPRFLAAGGGEARAVSRGGDGAGGAGEPGEGPPPAKSEQVPASVTGRGNGRGLPIGQDEARGTGESGARGESRGISAPGERRLPAFHGSTVTTPPPAGPPRRGLPGDAASSSQGPEALVLAVTGPKGGVGRTWLSCELGVVAAQSGWRVGLIDADWSAGDAGVLLDLAGGPTILDLQAVMDGPDGDWDEQWVVHGRSGLRLLAAPPHPELSALVEEGVLGRVVARARHRFDLVIIDGPAAPLWSRSPAVAAAADLCLLVTTPAPTSLRRARAWLDDRAHRGGEGAGDLAVTVNRWPGAARDRAEVEHYLRRPVLAWLPEDGAAVDAAVAAGVPLALAQPGHPLVAAVAELAARLFGWEAAPRRGGGLRRVLERLRPGGGARLAAARG